MIKNQYPSPPRYLTNQMALCIFFSLFMGFVGGVCAIHFGKNSNQVEQDINQIKCKNLKVVDSNGKTQIELVSTAKGPKIILLGNDDILSMDLAVQNFSTVPKEEQTAGLYVRKKGSETPPFAITVDDDQSSYITMGERNTAAFASLNVFHSKDHPFARLSVGGLHQANIHSGSDNIKISAGQEPSNIEYGVHENDPPYFLINDHRVKNGTALMKISQYTE